MILFINVMSCVVLLYLTISVLDYMFATDYMEPIHDWMGEQFYDFDGAFAAGTVMILLHALVQLSVVFMGDGELSRTLSVVGYISAAIASIFIVLVLAVKSITAGIERTRQYFINK